MKTLFYLILFFPCIAFSQILIPKPTEITTNDTIITATLGGDFDGDDFADILVYWGTEQVPGVGDSYNFLSVYSFKKNKHLLVIPGNGFKWYHRVSLCDLDNDGAQELLVRNIIYKYSNSDIKKKVR